MEDEEPLATRMLPHPGGWMEPVTLDLAYWKAFDWLVRQPDLSIAKFMKDAEELRGPRDFNQALESHLCKFYNSVVNFYVKHNIKPPPPTLYRAKGKIA